MTDFKVNLYLTSANNNKKIVKEIDTFIIDFLSDEINSRLSAGAIASSSPAADSAYSV